MSPEVVGVGNALVDITYVVSGLPPPGGGARVLGRHEAPGGVEANVVAGLARLGRRTGIIARVGQDAEGRRVMAALEADAVDARRVRTDPEVDTSYCLILRDLEGRRVILGGGEATLGLELEAADRRYLEGCAAVFTSGYAPPEVIAELAAWRSDYGALVFDLAGDLDDLGARGLGRDRLDAALPAIDLFVANERAALSYLGCAPGELAEAIAERGMRRAAVTRGERGALLVDGGRPLEVSTDPVEPVDTTGAGDAFTAALVDAWLLRDLSAREASRFAAAAAALACTEPGARDGLPPREAVLDRLRRSG